MKRIQVLVMSPLSLYSDLNSSSLKNRRQKTAPIDGGLSTAVRPN